MNIRNILVLCALAWAIVLPASAADLIVTRYFSGLWDQPKQESQGIVLQIIDQEEEGHKKAVAYWFTYGDNLDTAWYMGIGHVEGDLVLLNLYTADGVGFMEDDAPGNESVYAVGTLTLSFKNCNHGLASFNFDQEASGGEFEIKRLAGLYNSRCSGGISDDTPSHAKPIMLDVDLVPARDGVDGKGMAKFWERVDRSDFHVSAEDLVDSDYDIQVCEESVGTLTVVGGEGATQFRSPESAEKPLLVFDPRNCLIELHDAAGAVLTSGENVLAGKDHGNNGNGKQEIAVDLENRGVFPEAEGEASYVEKNNSLEFEVEIKGVPIGNYPLWVGNELRGEIVVAADDDDDDGTYKGKLRFSNPQKGERELLDFDPREMWVEVYHGETLIFDVYFE